MGVIRSCRKFKKKKVCSIRRGRRVCRKSCAKFSTHRR